MLFYGLLLLVVGTFGIDDDPGHCIHTNTEQKSADLVILEVQHEADANNDTYISEVEMLELFLQKLGTNGESVSRIEFINAWHGKYKDVPDFASYLFDHFDINKDEKITIPDAIGIHNNFDDDFDDRVSTIEFTLHMLHLYEDCVAVVYPSVSTR